MCAKNYEIWLAVEKSYFNSLLFGPSCKLYFSRHWSVASISCSSWTATRTRRSDVTWTSWSIMTSSWPGWRGPWRHWKRHWPRHVTGWRTRSARWRQGRWSWSRRRQSVAGRSSCWTPEQNRSTDVKIRFYVYFFNFFLFSQVFYSQKTLGKLFQL